MSGMASSDNVLESISTELHQTATELQQTTEPSTNETTPAPKKDTTTDAPQSGSVEAEHSQTPLTSATPEKSATEVTDESSSRAAEESSTQVPAQAGASATGTATTHPIEISDTKASADPETTAIMEGESSDQSKVETEDTGPSLVITLLLTTGARHPFKIDGKYLRKRGVNVENHDPFGMSVYTLKELIWREWRPEWEPRPSSPSSIRLISFGKLLDDKAPLLESKFNRDAPNVIHMTVKPQEVVDEEDAKGGKSYQSRDRDATERSPRCRCVIL